MICQKYYAKKDENGFPTPGTMMGYKAFPGSCGYNKCEHVLLENTTHTLQAGETRGYHPQGLRFFVSLDSKGNVRPNSLVSSLKVPRGTRTAEFIKVITS
jgi:hypothetical protein